MHRQAAVAVLSVFLVLGCSSGAKSPGISSARPTSSPTPTVGAPTTSVSSEPPECPNPEGQACLGAISAGTYTTTVFEPQLMYTVPTGWSNFEDTPGNFLLVPPSFDLPGVNGGTSDFIGVYAAVAAPNGCDSGTAEGVVTTYEGLTNWVRRYPAISLTKFHAVTVGGLHGVVMDVRIAPTWKRTCPYSGGQRVAPLITGLSPTGLDHNVGPGNATRLYLLDNAGVALCVEVVDIRDAHHLDRYSGIVDQLKFAV